ncbi:MAG: M20 metallopeptidase family protein [Candidatus Ratteibacteria bacterium]
MFDQLIEKEVKNIENEIIEWRRYFHMYPELGFEEYKTSEKIQSILKETGIPFEIKGKTGVIGFISKNSTKTLGIRADMDALPICEKTGLPFSSKNKGIMHACGHDGHMATVLGVGKILYKFIDYLKFNVKLIFQPCEEKPPGGATILIKEGVLENIDALIGFHFFPYIPIFKIYIEKGVVMANTDRFNIIIEGKGGHGSSPHLTNDPIICASYFISVLQTIISRKINPGEPAVISVCKIKGGEVFNIIPDKVEIEGTVRTLSEKLRKKIKNEIKNIGEKVSRSFNCKFNFTYNYYSPAVKNDEKLTEKIYELSRQFLPKKYFYKYHPIMGGEDFAFYTKIVPSTYIFIGSGKKSGIHHSSKFNLDEMVLPFAVKYFSQLILNFK